MYLPNVADFNPCFRREKSDMEEFMKLRRDKGEGSVYQRKSDGLWLAAFTPEGSSKTKYFSGKSEASVKKKLREYKKEIAKTDYVEIQKITVRDYMLGWFSEVKSVELKPKSLDALTHTMNNQVFPHLGDIQIAALNARDIQAMLNSLTSSDYSYSTIRKSFNAVNSCFKLAVIKGDLSRNPCLGVKLPKNILKRQNDNKRFLKQSEYEKLCNECSVTYPNGKQVYRLGQSVIVLLYTGMRIGELLGLRWTNIDFEKKVAKIYGSVVYVIDRDPNKSNDSPKYNLLEQDSLKTDTSFRTVQLNQKAIEALKSIQSLNGCYTHVMTNSNGKIMSPRNFDRMLRSLMVRCDIEPCGPHALRHTFASMLFRAGVDVKTVSELLGHRDVAFTYNEYIHLIEEQKQKAVDILDTL